MGQVRTRAAGGSSARSLARRLGLPAARGAAMGALAVTVVIGGGSTASAVSGIPGGPNPDMRGGWDQVALDDDAAQTAAQRLAAMGAQWSHARLDDALAIGRAALQAADASSELAGQAPQVDGLRTSVDALRAVVRAHGGVTVRTVAGSTVVPDAVTPAPALTPAERLAVAQEIAGLAADVFRVALEVEATAAAGASPGLPGLDAPPLRLTMPRPLEALEEPAAPQAAEAADGSATEAAAPGTDVPPPAEAPAQEATPAGGTAGDAAAPPADAGSAASPAPAAAEPVAGTEPAADAATGTDATAAGGDAQAAPASTLPAELADGLADLEAAVSAASGAATTELLSLEELPVLPSALGAASVGRWSSFLPDAWTALGLENGRIPEALLCAPDFAPDFLLRCDAAAALEAVNEAYRADFGEDLVVVSGYRSFDQQAGLRVAKGWLAAPAGRSNHGLGVAVDLGGFGGLGQFDSPRYRWMLANGERFGWVHPEAMRPGGGGPPEPWHFEFGTE